MFLHGVILPLIIKELCFLPFLLHRSGFHRCIWSKGVCLLDFTLRSQYSLFLSTKIRKWLSISKISPIF